MIEGILLGSRYMTNHHQEEQRIGFTSENLKEEFRDIPHRPMNAGRLCWSTARSRTEAVKTPTLLVPRALSFEPVDAANDGGWQKDELPGARTSFRVKSWELRDSWSTGMQRLQQAGCLGQMQHLTEVAAPKR